MTLSIAQALDWARNTLSRGESADTDAKVLLCHVLQQNRTYLYTWPEKLLTEDQRQTYESLVHKREVGEPVAYITGYREFWSLRLRVEPSTLIPRPDTELLVETALTLLDEGDTQVCDLGTGTGAIALAIASERANVHVTGVDKFANVVALAKTNAQDNQVKNVAFLQSHWFDAIAQTTFDMIVSNPPYVESNSPYLGQGDVRFEPRSALTAGEDGLEDIVDIIDKARQHLRLHGWLLIEHGHSQGQAIREQFAQAGYQDIHTYQDLAGLDRLTAAKRVSCE
ncbi:peptide chain release factor N(5)-glutamine methyltransferase [Alteromonas sp. C1M14]|uniref:peptide chain release factor N(5)-glutamine methyltransferase n=1 Tax=Alteromonas sp. C1M14 TaxID=2841567 RepID=UPI001C0A056F|nr:peptide chain release factor N(5)-glutamine methyltransferase [Alteromonas sp. C1M14]MBU2978878.1 peptide chain release factor N(5)-glutamine methyltransferase [Alteromonas sp. C1M14]